VFGFVGCLPWFAKVFVWCSYGQFSPLYRPEMWFPMVNLVFFLVGGGVVMGCSLSVFSQGVSWGYGVGFWYVRSGIVCF